MPTQEATRLWKYVLERTIIRVLLQDAPFAHGSAFVGSVCSRASPVSYLTGTTKSTGRRASGILIRQIRKKGRTARSPINTRDF
jgi:hypothetical protein